MAYLTAYQYYTNSGTVPTNTNWGSYQYVSLKDIVNNFLLMYAGNDKLVSNVSKHVILFHAKRGIQEINYDALKSIKVLELLVCDNLKFILPPDYVNYVRISVEKGGILYPLHENSQVNYATAYLQDNNCEVLFDQNGDVLEAQESELAKKRIEGVSLSQYVLNGPRSGQWGWNIEGTWYFGYGIGARFGLDTAEANQNPSFRIDKQGGVINFSSGVKDQLVVLEYISDGMKGGNNDDVEINKLAEQYLYSYIRWAILDNKIGVQEYVIRRARKDKWATLRNAKIRLSNIHPGRLLMPLRARANWLK